MDLDGRVISAEIADITFTNIYAPTGNQGKSVRQALFKGTIPAHILSSKVPSIVFGDFNAVNEEQYRAHSISKERIDRVMSDLIVSMELSNIYRVLRGLEEGHTL